MEPNKLEQEFRDKLGQRTIQPSKMAWDRLDAMLSVNEGKEEQKVIAIKPNRNWMYMAASFVVFATIGAFFLTRESGNGNNQDGTGTSVVNTEKTVQPEGTNDTVQPPGIQPTTNNLSAPTINSEVVASNGKAGSKQNYRTVTVTMPSQPICGYPIPLPPDSGIAEVAPENVKPNAQKDLEAEKLLAANHPAPKKKSAIKVDAGSLLSSVEGELDENFRDKALNGVIKNFNTVKSSVANRNYNK